MVVNVYIDKQLEHDTNNATFQHIYLDQIPQFSYENILLLVLNILYVKSNVAGGTYNKFNHSIYKLYGFIINQNKCLLIISG